MKKKDKKRKFSWGQAVFGLVLLVIVLIIGSFTTYGADAFQYFVNEKPQASWAPDLLWRSAKLYHFWGETFKGAKAFEKFYTDYAKIEPKRIVEAQYWEISCYNDGQQYQTCFDKVEEFVKSYEPQQEEPHIKEWFTRAQDIYKAMKTMEPSRMYNHPWY